MTQINVSTQTFAAYQAEVDERIANINTQLAVMSARIDALLVTQETVEFPDEQAQIREQVMTAFQDELSNFVTDLNTIKANISTLQSDVSDLQ